MLFYLFFGETTVLYTDGTHMANLKIRAICFILVQN
jgi:hypothetical protein